MKNLKLLNSSCASSTLLENAKGLCFDSDAECVYFADCTNIYYLKKNTKQVVPVSVAVSTDASESDIVQMDYVLETHSICITFSSGDIVTYSTVDEKVEGVGAVESGVHHAAFSPDQELFCVLTGGDTFILMTKDFDPLVEKGLHPADFGEKNPVSVGWGSKETQFHGSEGKAAAKVKKIVPKPAVSWDDKRHRISWRGDGDLFVTSVIDKEHGCRKLRIWNREGNLQYTSELKDGLEQCLCWRPSGNLIACTQQEPNKHKVIFFEKNGLQHGEFDLPFSPSTYLVKELVWNSDSSILLVWGHELKDQNPLFSVMLWTSKNYHWYLKQMLPFASGTEVKKVVWDQSHPYRLHVLCSSGQYLQYTWTWTHFHSRGMADGVDDVSTLAIDNSKALITPFRRMIVPPPMCSYSLNLKNSINFVSFAPGTTSEDFCLIFCDERIVFCSKASVPIPSGEPEWELVWNAAGGNGFKKVILPHYCKGIYSVSWEDGAETSLSHYPLSLHHWTWMADGKLLCVASQPESCESLLLSVHLPSPGDGTELTLRGRVETKLDGIVIGVCTSEDGSVAALQFNNGEIMKYSLGTISPWIIDNSKPLVLPFVCTHISIWSVDQKMVIVGMSERFTLCCNDVILPTTCTSFTCHDEYLLVTSCDNILKCYSKAHIKKFCFEKANVPESEIPTQQIEQGARIVVSVPKDTKVILQMPRGNLEVIHPRPLVLSSICSHLDNIEYLKAFDIAKRNRINLNILYDHNPEKFLESVEAFVEQLSSSSSSSNINLFLASLLNEDVSQTMYSFAYQDKPRACTVPENKRDVVCVAVQTVLEGKSLEKYFLSLIATYAQQSEPQLDKALMLIKSVKDQVKDDGNYQKTVDDGLKFLLYLVDVFELYRVALGTYDFEIAIMVAEKSNMDPKEYLSFLNELQALEENYRRYKVDMHLERYSKALCNISKCSDHFEECLALVKSRRLYKEALTLFPQGSEQFKVIGEEYGDYLMAKMYHSEAGLIYSKSACYEKALRAYQESCEWHMALSTARALGHSKEKLIHLCRDITRKMKENQRYAEAAYLLDHYIGDKKESICTLIEGHCWAQAFEAVSDFGDLSMLSTHLKPALEEHYDQFLSSVNETAEQFQSYADRLYLVRKQKEERALAYGSTEQDELYSEGSSMSGSSASSTKLKQLTGSLITRKSSRSRRKQALKKFRLKEGSPNEDLALMAELSELVAKVNNMKDTFLPFVKMLMYMDHDEQARDLQKAMKQLLKIVETEMPSIWKSQETASNVVTLNFGPNTTANDIAAAVQMQKKTGRPLTTASSPEVAPPPWQDKDIFLNIID